jgi:ParB family transcriptional regulator, chromosome partitioning protein
MSQIDDSSATMAMADENLVREDLADGEKAYFYAIRKDAYERLHPETKLGAGTGGRSGKTKDDFAKLAKSNDSESVDRFTAATAKVAGVGERTVRLVGTKKPGRMSIQAFSDHAPLPR